MDLRSRSATDRGVVALRGQWTEEQHDRAVIDSMDAAEARGDAVAHG